MDCINANEKMHAIIDREVIDQEVQDSLALHCAACEKCKQEFDSLNSLHDRMRSFAANIATPEGFQNRLRSQLASQQQDSGISQPANGNVLDFGKRRAAMGAAAAAAVALFLWSVPFFNRHPEPSSIVATVPAPALQTAPGSAVQAGPAQSSMAHAGDLVANYKSGVGQTSDVSSLSGKAGFAVNALAFSGLHVSAGEVCDIAGKRFVRLTYSGAINGKQSTVACYVCPTGAFDSKGLDVHVIGGRKLCCGRMQAVSLVYIPSKHSDYVLVAEAPKATLMELALKS